jgi:hypothetical protein
MIDVGSPVVALSVAPPASCFEATDADSAASRSPARR